MLLAQPVACEIDRARADMEHQQAVILGVKLDSVLNLV